jgi:hypothetical protein
MASMSIDVGLLQAVGSTEEKESRSGRQRIGYLSIDSENLIVPYFPEQ